MPDAIFEDSASYKMGGSEARISCGILYDFDGRKCGSVAPWDEVLGGRPVLSNMGLPSGAHYADLEGAGDKKLSNVMAIIKEGPIITIELLHFDGSHKKTFKLIKE